MPRQTEAKISPTDEILDMCTTKVPEYVSRKRRNLQLGDVIGHLNYELMFGSKDKKHNASAALEKLGYVLD